MAEVEDSISRLVVDKNALSELQLENSSTVIWNFHTEMPGARGSISCKGSFRHLVLQRRRVINGITVHGNYGLLEPTHETRS